ncbi:AIR carboxylase family protein, partial [Staphylococcus epidermidis]|uniref:AIR carboxylase family protein n=1 Tax=Staphylococcus epidermidis TaxID=1282 RepID=UPI0037D9991E
MKETCSILEQFEIPYQNKLLSAHPTPQMVFNFPSQPPQNPFHIIIPRPPPPPHLPPILPSITTLPLIPVPIQS